MKTTAMSVSLLDLRLSEEWPDQINARGEGELNINILAAQIAENDFNLIQALGVVEGKDNKGKHAFGVFAGGRRLRALRQLAAQKKIEPNHHVDVVVHEVKPPRALEMSVVENDPAYRLPPHPLDQCDAFEKLIAQSKTIDEIATYYVTKPWFVRQRLALAALSSKIKAAWREEKIDRKTAEAFTLTSSPKVQNELFDRLTKQNGLAEWNVRNALAKNSNLGKLLMFVGVDEYKARGGQVISDLFSANTDAAIPEDADLVRTMASEKVAATRQQLTEQGWGFVGTTEELGHGAEYWKRAKVDVDFGDEAPRVDELDKKLKKMEKDDEDYSDEYDELKGERAELEEAAIARSADDKVKAKSGVLIDYDHNAGELKIMYALVKPKEASAAKSQSHAAKTDGPKKDPAELSAALVMDLGSQATVAAANVLGQDHQLALCVVCAAIMSRDYESPSKITHNGKGNLGSDGKGSFETHLKAMIAKKPGERLAFLAALAGASLDISIDRKETAALLAACPAPAFDKAMRAAFDPERYFNGVSKALSLKALKEAVSPDAAKAVESKSKSEIVKAAVDQVPKTGWLPPELRASHYPGPPGKAPKTGSKPTKTKAKTRK